LKNVPVLKMGTFVIPAGGNHECPHFSPFFPFFGTTLTIDLSGYLIGQADRILGILLHLVGMSPAASAA